MAYLREHPYCTLCRDRGVVTRATVVDHIQRWKNADGRVDWNLFWDADGNWQGLCSTCHQSVKQAFERTGVLRGCDESGVPLDSNHHWRA